MRRERDRRRRRSRRGRASEERARYQPLRAIGSVDRVLDSRSPRKGSSLREQRGCPQRFPRGPRPLSRGARSRRHRREADRPAGGENGHARRPEVLRARGAAPGRAHLRSRRAASRSGAGPTSESRAQCSTACASGGALPRRVYRELQGVEAGDRMLESYDEEDAASPAATPEAADDRLTAYLAGIATAIAVGTMMAAPRENVDADGRDVTPEDLARPGAAHGAGEGRRGAPPRPGAHARRAALLLRADPRRGRCVARASPSRGAAGCTRAPSRPSARSCGGPATCSARSSQPQAADRGLQTPRAARRPCAVHPG